MSVQIKEFLKHAYPSISHLFDQVETIEPLTSQNLDVREAVIRIVIGQMLSRVAATSIHNRVLSLARQRGYQSTWQLTGHDFISCGISKNKVRTITEFLSSYENNSVNIDRWIELEPDKLFKEVSQYWGMSDWTASMLSIFYFGHPDVYPYRDGTIKKAEALLERYFRENNENFDADLAKPYRSILALYFWKFVDQEVF